MRDTQSPLPVPGQDHNHGGLTVSYTEISAALAPLGMRVIYDPNFNARNGGVFKLERLGGRREIARVNKWYVIEDWQITGYFRNADTDAALDEFVQSVWTALKSMAIPDSFDSEYLPVEPGQLRLAEVRITTIRMENIR